MDAGVKDFLVGDWPQEAREELYQRVTLVTDRLSYEIEDVSAVGSRVFGGFRPENILYEAILAQKSDLDVIAWIRPDRITRWELLRFRWRGLTVSLKEKSSSEFNWPFVGKFDTPRLSLLSGEIVGGSDVMAYRAWRVSHGGIHAKLWG